MEFDKTSRSQKILLIIFGLFCALLFSEFFIRFFGIDLLILRKALYYQCSYTELHRTSQDPNRLYELAPRRTVQGRGQQTFSTGETRWVETDLTVNSLGFRNKEFPAHKREGVFRIALFGGSNTFGMNVSDGDTYPTQMQKIFDEKYPGKIEVWNAGICAYQMSQNVAYAETVLREFDPDLIILQDTNRGRRAFHQLVTLSELKRLFRQNKELYIENIPPLWNPDVSSRRKISFFLSTRGSNLHYFFVSSSALYRSLCITLYSWVGVFSNGSPIHPVVDKYFSIWNHVGQQISNRELNLFTALHQDKKIILFFISSFGQKIGREGIKMRNNMTDFVLRSEEKSQEYQDIHPPPYVYAWYAEELCDFLIQKGYFPQSITHSQKN